CSQRERQATRRYSPPISFHSSHGRPVLPYRFFRISHGRGGRGDLGTGASPRQLANERGGETWAAGAAPPLVGGPVLAVAQVRVLAGVALVPLRLAGDRVEVLDNHLGHVRDPVGGAPHLTNHVVEVHVRAGRVHHPAEGVVDLDGLEPRGRQTLALDQ